MPQLDFTQLNIAEAVSETGAGVSEVGKADLPPLPDSNHLAASKPPAISYKQKSRFPHEVIWPVVALMLIGFGVVAWNADPLQLSLRGKLEAERVTGELGPQIYPIAELADSEDDANSVLELLHRTPVSLTSEVMTSAIEASASGLVTRVIPGPAMSLVRVQVPPDSGLGRALSGRTDALNESRKREIRESVKTLRDILQSYQKTKSQDTQRLLAIRDSLILTLRVGATGYSLEAKVGSSRYPCLLEESGLLYFAIPAGHQRFDLVGRSNPVSVPSGRWEVQITGETVMPNTDQEIPPWRSK